MLDIIILEKNQAQLAWFTDFITRYTTFENLHTTVKLATNEMKAVKNYVAVVQPQNVLFFLDSELQQDGLTGIEFGEHIRNCLPLANIVFFTEFQEISIITVKKRLAALDCISKKQNQNEVEAAIRADITIALKRTVVQMRNNTDRFVYKLRNCYYDIPLAEIMYIASTPNRVNRVKIHAKNLVIEINDSLLNIEKKYSTLFRCHKGFIINPLAITYIDIEESKVYFDSNNQIWCPLSVRRKKHLKKLLEN